MVAICSVVLCNPAEKPTNWEATNREWWSLLWWKSWNKKHVLKKKATTGKRGWWSFSCVISLWCSVISVFFLKHSSNNFRSHTWSYCNKRAPTKKKNLEKLDSNYVCICTVTLHFHFNSAHVHKTPTKTVFSYSQCLVDPFSNIFSPKHIFLIKWWQNGNKLLSSFKLLSIKRLLFYSRNHFPSTPEILR